MEQTPADREIAVARSHSDDDRAIAQPERIAAILDEINRRPLLIGVRREPDGPLYNSLLVRLDPTQKRLYLDEFSPLEDHRQMHAGQGVRIHASLRGIAIRFSTTVEEILLEDGHHLYAGSYPTQIVYLQRRHIFRVRLPLYDRRHVIVQDRATETEFAARILDLSVRGFCLEVGVSDLDETRLGARFRYAGMELPGQRSPLSGEAVLVNLRPSPRSGTLSAGFEIANLDPLTERSLMRAALYYQREAKKLVD